MSHAILFVDDEQAICSALKRTFKQSPYTVYEANSGQQALSLLQQQEVDVVVSDQRMPGMNGTELLSIVKEKYPTVGRVILSGYSDFDALVGAVNEANIFRFLPKPWNDDTLLQTVDDVISSKQNMEVLSSPLEPENHQTELPSYNKVDYIGDAFLKRQIDLEKAIKNDELSLTEHFATDANYTDNSLNYFFLNWPKHHTFTHKNIIDMARQAGYLEQLYTWYIFKCISSCEQKSPRSNRVVIDLFCEEMVSNKALRELLSSAMHKNCHLVFRIPFDLLSKPCLGSLLKETHSSNSSIMLILDKRIINVNELSNTPINYLEMNACNHVINNAIITHKRKQMLDDAHYLSIKTILTGVKNSEQLFYTKVMNFDFLVSS